jgi:signal transduction histidine kinase
MSWNRHAAALDAAPRRVTKLETAGITISMTTSGRTAGPDDIALRDAARPVPARTEAAQSRADAGDVPRRAWLKLANPSQQHLAVVTVIVLAMGGVFVFDIVTPPDDVSICFIYAVLVSFSIFSFRGAAYVCAALATLLSAIGAFVQTPPETLTLAFFANRAIAVCAQWLVAFVVTTRKDAEMSIQAKYQAERAKAETSQRFVDMLSHEIGTSLTAIGGHAFRLKRLKPDLDTVGYQARAQKIEEAVRHIEAVVRQVQVAAEVDYQTRHIHREPLSFPEFVGDLVEQYRTDRDIRTDLVGLPSRVWGSAEMLHQVISNLLSNAIKFSTPGTVISVFGYTADDCAVLAFSDRGRGIPPSEMGRLFDPYYRARNSRGVPGTGIGLFVVKHYVESHGGSIAIESIEDKGTTVTVRIPVSRPDGA